MLPDRTVTLQVHLARFVVASFFSTAGGVRVLAEQRRYYVLSRELCRSLGGEVSSSRRSVHFIDQLF